MKNFIKDNKTILIVIARIIALFGVLFTLAKRYNIGIHGLEHRG